MKVIPALLIAVFLFTGCSGDTDNSHTTATTLVSPPARQVLRAESRPASPAAVNVKDLDGNFDPAKPLLIFNLPNGKTFREGEEVVVDFSLANAKLRGDGGEYRVRYMVDDDDMQWIERLEQVVLTGWLPGTHTIRVELVGPDGWPYRNGDYNVVTRELTVVK
ncbi:MAG TPA: hypothetical protein VFS77_09665 [Pyrinomonadaceae bacterium]|nr:hypothetical protein [Pyrinomonadaceae bacterium]